MTLHTHLEAYPEAIREPLRRLHESLGHAVQIFTAVQDSIASGTYTRQAAEEDLENLTMADGIDVFSTLADLVEDECETW